MDKQVSEIGARIRQLRKDKGLSQQDCAEQLDISVPHLSDIENGKTNFGIDILARITEVFQVSADWLLQTDTPELTGLRNAEISEILADCSPAEYHVLLRTLQEMKALIVSQRGTANS